MGLLATLGRGDATCAPFFLTQMSTAPILTCMRHHSEVAAIQAECCRVVGALLVDDTQTRAFITAGGLEVMQAAEAAHGDVIAVANEVANVLEQAVCVMCAALNDAAPEEDLDTPGMITRLYQMDITATTRLATVEIAATAAAVQEAAASAEEARGMTMAAAEVQPGVLHSVDGGDVVAERGVRHEVAAASSAYSGFAWSSVSSSVDVYEENPPSSNWTTIEPDILTRGHMCYCCGARSNSIDSAVPWGMQ